MSYRRTANFRTNSLLSVLILVAILVALFFIVRGVFIVLSWIAPLLLIAAFFIDRSVVINYGKWLIQQVKANPLLGIGAILLTLIGYMVVFPFLFAKALLKKKVKDVHQRYERESQGELIDFEEIESKSRRIELPPIPQKEKRSGNGEYDRLFD